MILLSGDGKTYDMYVCACDFANDATKLSADFSYPEGCRDSLVNMSYERVDRFTFLCHFSNYSTEADTLNCAQQVNVTFRAENERESAETLFKLMICPEGISVLSPTLNAEHQLVINTEDADPGEGVDIRPTELRLLCAYRKGEQIVTEVSGFSFGALTHTDTMTWHVLSAFEYDINDRYAYAGYYYFNPHKVVPTDPRRPYIVTLPIFHPAGGLNASRDLPVRLDGEAIPMDELIARDEEWELLKRTCMRYGLGSNSKAQTLMRQISRANAPSSVLRQIRREILIEAQAYYSAEATEMTELGDKMDRICTYLNTAKWFGDQARSYLLKYWGGGSGELVELIVNPLIDLIFVDILGEVFFRDAKDINLLESTLKSLETMAENKFSSLMTGSFMALYTGGNSATNGSTQSNQATNGSTQSSSLGKQIWKTVGWFACYNGVVFAKHYWLDEETKGDFGKSLAATARDLSVTALKTAIGKALNDWINTRLSDGAEGVFTVMRENAETHAIERVNCTQFEVWVTQFFRWGRRNSNQKIKAVFEYFFQSENKFFKKSIVQEESVTDAVASTLIDGVSDVFASSPVDSIFALIKGDRLVLKLGDAEYHFGWEDTKALLWDVFEAFYNLPELWRLIAGAEKNPVTVPKVIPHADTES